CFLSSRRRHTIFKCDWSSDVCSSAFCSMSWRFSSSTFLRKNLMRYSESTEENLRKEVEELKRQLMEQKALIDGPAGPAHAGKIWHPSSITIWALFLGI